MAARRARRELRCVRARRRRRAVRRARRRRRAGRADARRVRPRRRPGVKREHLVAALALLALVAASLFANRSEPPAAATRASSASAVSYTHLRAHETGRNLVCRLLLEK